MADTIAVKPASADARLVHPVAGPLPAEGGAWPADQFTFRRLRDGDVKRLADAPASAPEPAASPAKSTAAADAAKAAKDNA